MIHTDDIAPSLVTLFGELVNGAATDGAYVLNGGDVGILDAFDGLTAEAASRNVSGGATVAAHVAHLQYGLSLMNEWATRGGNPFATADWTQAWRVGDVAASEWDELRRGLRAEAEKWLDQLRRPRQVSVVELNGMIGSIVHLAYHLGALRQIEPQLRGPQENASA